MECSDTTLVQSAAWVVLLALAGCSSQGDSLVVVTVDAAASIDSVAVLHTTSTAGGRMLDHDFSGNAPFSIPPSRTFGVQVASSISGAFTIHVEARDTAGRTLAAGDGATTLAPGQRSDVDVTLAASATDGGTDGGADLAPPATFPPAAVWISSGGGSAAAGAARINLSVGGVDAVGSVSAPGGAQMTSGFFATDTY
jgi:hypothetical protein